MHRNINFVRLLIGVLLSTLGLAAFGQTVAIGPKSPTIALGATVQFSATATGLSSQSVTWYAGGTAGGNATAGTISASGLYTAPSTMPAQCPVQITAKSKANTKISASTYLNLLVPGPAITSVWPSPLAVGSYVVTIHGTGFAAGASVVNTSNGQAIQLVTDSVSPDKITADGYQGPAPSATFTVVNPGSTHSNGITVPVTSSVSTYNLTVQSGTGTGSYASGTSVAITANAPPLGQVFVNWTGAVVANPNAATTTLTMPAENTTVTANYGVAGKVALTVVNGSGSGSYSAGTVVNISANAAPTGQTFVNWTGAPVASATSPATTITIPSTNTTVIANYVAAATIPFPVTTHPRLWITPSQLPTLQKWASTSNPVYAKGIVPLLAQAVSDYTTQYFPNGVQNPNYPDFGDVQGYQGLLTEQDGLVLALNSLIDPVAANRIKYAQYARNILMVAMNQAALGHLANAPFRDPAFAIYNRAGEGGAQWPLIVDWLYSATDGSSNPILTAADKATIRKVFLIWANDCLNAETTGGDHPSPVGVTNSTQLLPNSKAYRMAANNYYLGHARLVTMMSLCIDPSDDPAVNPSVALSKIGNSLRSYILDATGAWLYQEYAMFGEPATVGTAYGVPSSGLGLSSGGLPPEGFLYGVSFASIFEQLLALQTAGFSSPSLSGPQIGLATSPVWDRYVTGFLSSLTPSSQVPAMASYLGPIYQFANYGDLLEQYVAPDEMMPFALLDLLNHQTGKTSNDNAVRWMTINSVQGGAAGLYDRIANPWTWGCMDAVLSYLVLDPNAPAPTDPRLGFSPLFVDNSMSRIVAHSDWTPSGTMFDYRASWISINHQVGDGGQFEFLRNGEWLTKEMSNYDSNGIGMTTPFHNTLSLQNWCANGTPSGLQWYESGEWNNGSQWMEGSDAGDPTTVTSSGPGYVYATSNLTNLYNRPSNNQNDAAVSITQATRSIMWLNKDFVVVYDRATSANANQFKRFNLSLINTPLITGSVATETVASGQQLFVQSLLPVGGHLSSVFGAGEINNIATLEPSQYILSIQDPSNPKDTRFLTVLQGANALTPMTTATHVASTSGVAFDGAVFGANAVYFPTNVLGTLTATTFSLPTGVHSVYVAGLAANSSYGYTVQTTASGSVVTLTPSGTTAVADAGGVITIGL
jgi:hypothetical protein